MLTRQVKFVGFGLLHGTTANNGTYCRRGIRVCVVHLCVACVFEGAGENKI